MSNTRKEGVSTGMLPPVIQKTMHLEEHIAAGNSVFFLMAQTLRCPEIIYYTTGRSGELLCWIWIENGDSNTRNRSFVAVLEMWTFCK